MTATEALHLISDRDPDRRHAAEKAIKAIQVISPIRVRRLIGVTHDALNHGGGSYSDEERQAIRQAVADYVRANRDSQ